MSLNKFTDITEEHKWMNINCNNLSLGAGVLKTQFYVPIFQISPGNAVTSTSGFLYTCDYSSLRIKGWVNYSKTDSTPQNNIRITISLPNELKDRFSAGVPFSTGSVSEYPNNNNVNNGSVVYGDYDINSDIQSTIFYNNGNQSTAISFRANLDIVIFKS